MAEQQTLNLFVGGSTPLGLTKIGRFSHQRSGIKKPGRFDFKI